MPREQEFSQRVIYTAALAANGKLSLDDAYNNIKLIWKQLKRSKKQLGIVDKSKVRSHAFKSFTISRFGRGFKID